MLFFVVILFVCAIIALLIYARWEHGVLEKMGIPIVPYDNPLLGHIRELYENVGPFQDIEWRKKYGKIFGIYEGREPQVFICVPELVKLICVKDAEYFNSKRMIEFGDPIANEFPDFAPYNKWRAIRSMVTPTFTSAKLKLMSYQMKEATLDYVASLKELIKEGKGNKLQIDSSVHAMLTDLILRAIFSLKIDGGFDNEFSSLIKQILVPPSDVGMSQELIYCTHVFPFLRKFVSSPTFPKGVLKKFIPVFNLLVDQRRKSGKKGDVFDIIVEWFDNLGTPEFEKAGITKNTLICQTLVYFSASQDQISLMISAVIFHMMESPDLERKIVEEVERIFKKYGGKIEREHLKECVLLEASILECTRLYPLFHKVERVCTRDWRCPEFNLEVKKGTVVMFPLWAINRDPDYTENAEEFQPERFLPGRREKLNPYAVSGFGHGQRGCVGVKFAMDIMLTVLVYLIKEFKFVKREDTQLKFVPGGPFFVLHEPVFVDLIEREVK